MYVRRSILAQVPLASLELDAHARSKMIRLVGPERYDSANDAIVLESARCPTRKQNYDFLRYVLQVCLCLHVCCSTCSLGCSISTLLAACSAVCCLHSAFYAR